VTNQIAPNGDFNPSTEIQLQGRILDKRCRPISNAVVDVWYAGGNPGMCTGWGVHIFTLLTFLSLLEYYLRIK